MTDKEKCLDIIFTYGMTDGAHHKQWVIDQVARILLGNQYEEFIKEYIDEDFEWDEGIAP